MSDTEVGGIATDRLRSLIERIEHKQCLFIFKPSWVCIREI